MDNTCERMCISERLGLALEQHRLAGPRRPQHGASGASHARTAPARRADHAGQGRAGGRAARPRAFMNSDSLSSRSASSLRKRAVLAVSLRLCTKMSTWCLPADSSTCVRARTLGSAFHSGAGGRSHIPRPDPSRCVHVGVRCTASAAHASTASSDTLRWQGGKRGAAAHGLAPRKARALAPAKRQEP